MKLIRLRPHPRKEEKGKRTGWVESVKFRQPDIMCKTWKFVKPVFCIAQLSDGLAAAGVWCSKRGVLGWGGCAGGS